MQMISILIIVRNASVRQFVVDTLQGRTEFHVTGVYESLNALLAEPERRESPRVVLLDHNLQATGLHALNQLKRRMPETAIVLFTFANNSEDIYNAFAAGASGHILQSDPVEDMISSIHDILSGDMIVLPSIAQKILDTHFLSNECMLTVSEVRFMQVIAAGHAMPYIRDTLMIPVQTIRSQTRSIFRKLHQLSIHDHFTARSL